MQAAARNLTAYLDKAAQAQVGSWIAPFPEAGETLNSVYTNSASPKELRRGRQDLNSRKNSVDNTVAARQVEVKGVRRAGANTRVEIGLQHRTRPMKPGLYDLLGDAKGLRCFCCAHLFELTQDKDRRLTLWLQEAEKQNTKVLERPPG